MYSIIYRWDGNEFKTAYESPSYDNVVSVVNMYGNLKIETIQKVLIGEAEPKLSANFYYIKNG